MNNLFLEPSINESKNRNSINKDFTTMSEYEFRSIRNRSSAKLEQIGQKAHHRKSSFDFIPILKFETIK